MKNLEKNAKNGSNSNVAVEEELRRQMQVMMVKESEIESLKKQVKKYKDLASESESTKTLSKSASKSEEIMKQDL